MTYPERPVFTEPDFTCTRRLPGRDCDTGICGACQAGPGTAHDRWCRRYELENPHLTGKYWGVEPVTYLTLGAAYERHARTIGTEVGDYA